MKKMPTIYTSEKLPERRKNDFYPTPIELCKASLAHEKVIEAVLDFANIGEENLRILDPGCGTGVWGLAWREVWKTSTQYYKDAIIGIDTINREIVPKIYDSFIQEDFLKFNFYDEDVHFVIGNPPYIYAEEFVRKSLDLLVENGLLIFLMKIPFINGQQRAKGLYKEYPLYHLAVPNRRPSFSGDRKTNADDYGVFIWKKGYKGETTLDHFYWNYEDE